MPVPFHRHHGGRVGALCCAKESSSSKPQGDLLSDDAKVNQGYASACHCPLWPLRPWFRAKHNLLELLSSGVFSP